MKPFLKIGDEADLDEINALYNHYILNSVATFDLTPHSLGDRRSWFEQFENDSPHQLWVLREPEQLLGFACSQPFRAKAGYEDTVETSIYLAPSVLGRGLGPLLYQRLFDALDTSPVHSAIAMITLPNRASLKLHERMGFTSAGTLLEAGVKFKRRLSVQIMQRMAPIAAANHLL